MRSPIVALFWYKWLETRYFILGAIAACLGIHLVCLTWIWMSPKPSDIAFVTTLNLGLCGYMLAGLAAVALFQDRKGHESAVANPGPYLLTMPAPTRYVTAVLLVYLVIVVGALASGVAVLSKVLLGDYILIKSALTPFPYWQYPLLCIYEALLFQAILLLSGVRNEVLGLSGICALLVLMGAGLGLIVMQTLQPYRVPLWLAGMAAACWFSHVGVKHFRCQRRESLIPWMVELSGIGVGRQVPFRSPARALAWYGWRRYGRLLVIFTALAVIMMVAFTFFDWWINRDVIGAPFRHIVANTHAAIAGTALIFGFVLMLLDAQDFLRGAYFLLVLPVRSLRLAWGVLLPTAAALTLTAAAVTAILLLVLRMTVSPEAWHAMLSMDTVAYSLGGVTLGWAAIWLAIPFFYLAAAASCTAGIGYLLFTRPAPVGSAPFWVAAIMVIFIVVGFLPFAARKGYLVRKNLACMAVAWLWALCAAGAIAVYWSTASFPTMMTPAHYTALFAATVFSPVPFLYIPAVIDLLRHR